MHLTIPVAALGIEERRALLVQLAESLVEAGPVGRMALTQALNVIARKRGAVRKGTDDKSRDKSASAPADGDTRSTTHGTAP